jgi:site-specific DNA recombinase
MRQLAPQFHVYLVRLCDGGHLLPRARVTLVLGGDVPEVGCVPGLRELLTMDVTLDLFDRPPQRERIREEAVRLAAQGVDQRQIAGRLSEKATQPAVQRALALDRMMRASGAVTPYAPLLEPPADYSKLGRHRNSKYQFISLPGYERPSI